jgi:ligand-binding sensor domain-containing protein
MSTEAYELVIDFDDVGEKREFMTRVGRAKGKWRIRLNRARPGMTYQQQKYYFAAHVTLLHQFLTEREWKGTKDELHEMLKHKFLRRSVVDPKSGKVLGYVTGSTQKLSSIAMADFMENVAQWLAEQFNIVVPPPDVYHQAPQEKRKKSA